MTKEEKLKIHYLCDASKYALILDLKEKNKKLKEELNHYIIKEIKEAEEWLKEKQNKNK
tara:strand:+ start:537 stop:713 length:177 start_codon:yes stop_codon:yes gene_type:complete